MGETFLYKELEEIVDYIKSKNKGIIISVSTNANLPNFIEKVSKIINKVDTIQISTDGLKKTYELIRKKATFNKLNENLDLLVKYSKNSKTDLMLNMVVTKENYHQMSSLIKYAEKKGIYNVDYTLFNLASVTNIEASYYNFYRSPEFNIALSELKNTIENTKKVSVRNRNFKTDNEFQKCPFPWTHFYISWNGFVPPCCAKPFPKELNFGNVFEYKVIEILNSNSFRKFRKLWFKNKTPNFCKKCHFIDIEPIK